MSELGVETAALKFASLNHTPIQCLLGLQSDIQKHQDDRFAVSNSHYFFVLRAACGSHAACWVVRQGFKAPAPAAT